MKLVRVGLLCVVLSGWGCGGDDDSGAASSCSVHPDDAGGGAVIECDDGTRTTVAPMPATASCSVKQGSSGTKTITCSDGTKIEVRDGTNGKNGTNGTNGTNGEKGPQGEPGMDGENGAPAADALDRARRSQCVCRRPGTEDRNQLRHHSSGLASGGEPEHAR